MTALLECDLVTEPQAFYLPDGDRFVPTILTAGPWDAAAQHAGPPSALLAWCIENNHPRPDLQTVRVTVEILGPLPLTPLIARSSLVRSGRSVEVLSGTLSSGGKDLLRAALVRIRTADIPAAELPPSPPPPSGPETGGPSDFFPTGRDLGYHSAMECSFLRGGFTVPGPATAWMRMRCALVEGQPITPLSRVLVAADSGNGLSSALDYRRWIFINPDLTVYLHRLPRGEWVCLEAATAIEPHGVGLAESRLFDQDGPLGRSLQSLFVAPRP